MIPVNWTGFNGSKNSFTTEDKDNENHIPSVRKEEKRLLKKTTWTKHSQNKNHWGGFLSVLNKVHFSTPLNTGTRLKQTRWNTTVVAARNSAPKQERWPWLAEMEPA